MASRNTRNPFQEMIDSTWLDSVRGNRNAHRIDGCRTLKGTNHPRYAVKVEWNPKESTSHSTTQYPTSQRKPNEALWNPFIKKTLELKIWFESNNGPFLDRFFFSIGNWKLVAPSITRSSDDSFFYNFFDELSLVGISENGRSDETNSESSTKPLLLVNQLGSNGGGLTWSALIRLQKFDESRL